MKPHISYSELKKWSECSWRHKLEYIDGLNPFKGNEYTSFGKALHSVSEKFVTEEVSEKPEKYFEIEFLNELKDLKLQDPELILDAKLVQDMRLQGATLAPQIIPFLKEHFGEYKLISVEEELYEPLADSKKKFKGFIDLVLEKEGTYHVIDWKTCSWGWNHKKKQDRVLSYQLTLYKHFFSQKHKIDSKKIKTHFALLKRTAKTNQVEIFEVSSGQKKTENALNLLNTALYNINNKRFIKNKLSCKYCPFDSDSNLCKK
jgi:ATP-dependent exoDNAse (exonuclease V) beta subunit